VAIQEGVCLNLRVQDSKVIAGCAGCGPGPEISLLDGTKEGDQLPALGFGEAGPGRHAVAEIALAQKPLEVAIRGGTNVVAFKGRLFAAVAHRVGLVALLTVFAVNEGACRNRFGAAGKRVYAGVFPGRDVVEDRAGVGTGDKCCE
jgi:hypothetical protein